MPSLTVWDDETKLHPDDAPKWGADLFPYAIGKGLPPEKVAEVYPRRIDTGTGTVFEWT